MKKVNDFIPWKVTDISLRPYKQMWSMNPSIHFDGGRWRCLLRCTDYAMPDGLLIRSSRAQRGLARTRNAIVLFDPQSWKPVEIYKMHEHDGFPRAPCENLGYEDMRLFTTDKGGLQGIAASLHLRRENGESQNFIPEQVVLSFDENYDVIKACPIRGAWGELPQKNWAPFDRCTSPRFLYSIGQGTLFDDRGILSKDRGTVCPSEGAVRRIDHAPDTATRKRARARALAVEEDRALAHMQERGRHQRRAHQKSFEEWAHEAQETATYSSASFHGLRGGTQLCRVRDDAWLGLGHEMRLVKNRKYYWHVWYLVDAQGTLQAASPPMKLAQRGIEFAAGLGIEKQRVVVSFGVDDMECCLGETLLAEVLAILRPVAGADAR